MKAVILAAGEGARMGPFTASEPKVMIPIGNRPILEHVIEACVGAGIRDILVVVGYRRERIMNHFEDGGAFDARVEYVTQGKQLGTAHALASAQGKVVGGMLVLPGDNLIDAALLTGFLGQASGTSLLISESDTPGKYGVVEVRDGKLQRLVEKPRQASGNLVSTGIYTFPQSIFDALAASIQRGRHDLTDVLEDLLLREPVHAVFASGTWIDAAHPWDLLTANASALVGLHEGKAGTIEKGVTIRGKVSIGDGSTLRAGTYIQGPVAIGEGCDIGPNAVLLPSTSLGADVRLGAFTVVENSLLMDSVVLGHHSLLQNCVVGEGVKAAAGLNAASGKADVEMEGEWHRLAAIGGMLGEDAEIGPGVVVEPGTTLGTRCQVRAGARVRGKVPSGTTVM